MSPARAQLRSLVHLLAMAVLICLGSYANALALTSSTVLTLSTSTTQAGNVVQLTAAVAQGSSAVTVGSVTFWNGSRLLGTAPIAGTNPGRNYVTGSASLWMKLGPGSYNVTAHFAGTSTVSASDSAAQHLTVTGMEPSVTAVAARPNGINFDVSVSVTGSGFGAPAGNVPVTDRTTSASLGNVSLLAAGQTLRPQVAYDTRVSPMSVAIGDLNGDGIPDVVTANSGTGDVSILLGDPNNPGNLLRQFRQAAGGGASAVAIADVNGDGVPDIVVANATDGTISVILGSGDNPGAEFATQVVYAVGVAPAALMVGDVNGDGIPDVIVANSGDNTVSVLIGNAGNRGSFLPAMTYATGSAPASMALGDFTGDGTIDIAVANSGENTVSILPGDPAHAGQFLGKVNVALSDMPGALLAADLNNDGRLDLVATFAAKNSVGVLLADSAHAGKFLAQQTYAVGPQPSSLAVSDLDGDGLLDILATNSGDKTVSTLLGDKAHPGQLLPQQIYVTANVPTAVAVADFNGDGVPDVVVANAGVNGGSNTVSLLLGGTMSQGMLTNVPLAGNGPHTIQATYPTGALYTTSMGSAIATVTPLATSTTLSVGVEGAALPVSGIVGSTQTLTLTVSIAPGTVQGLTAGGSVSFLDAATAIASCPTTFSFDGNGNGVATCSLVLPVGVHSLKAAYNATVGGHFASSSSAVIPLSVVVLTASNLILTGPANALAGQPAEYSLVVTDQLNNVVTNFVGTVHFASSDTNATLPADYTLALADLGRISFAILFGSAGPQTVTVSTGLLTATLPVRVSVPSTTTLNVDPLNASPGQVVTLVANVSATGGPVPAGGVTFLDGKRVLGTAQIVGPWAAPGFTSGYAQLKVRLGLGSHAITATFGGIRDVLGSVSAAKTAVIAGVEPTTTVMSATADGANYDLAATVSGFGAVAPAGTVSFADTTAGVSLGTAVAVAPLAQASFLAQTYHVEGTLTSPVVDDLNGDGIPDIVAADSAGNQIVVLLGDPANAGQFLPPAAYPVGSNPVSVAIADCNADGVPDLLVANSSDGTLGILLGNGDGTFQPQRTFSAGNQPASIATGLWNGDGAVDAAILNAADGTVSVLMGNGDGTFQTRQSYTVGSDPSAMISVDLNGDGFADLVVANGGDNSVSVLLAKQDGSFLPATTFSVEGNPVAMISADLNGDGIVDLAVAMRNRESISVLLGKGDGGFHAGPSIALHHTPASLAVADTNGDGRADLEIASSDYTGLTTLLGNGDGTFQAAADRALTSAVGSVVLGDWNGDGLTDALLTNAAGPDFSVELATIAIPVHLTNIPLLGLGLHNVQATYSPGPGVAAEASDSNIVSLAGGMAAQTISFGPLATVVYGSSPVSLSATATSGLAVTFNVNSGPGHISGNTLSVTGAGQIVIAADQGGNGMYAAAQTAYQALTVNPAHLTVTPDSASRIFGASNPVFTGVLAGVVNGDSIIATYASAADLLTVPGVYASGASAIHATLSDAAGRIGNYDITLNTGTLTITGAPQTITFGAVQSATYGGSAVQLSATVNSPLSVVYTVVSGPGRISNNSLVPTGAGTVLVQADQSGNASYLAAAPVRQSVTVDRAQLAVTPNAAARSYGAPNPVFTGTISGAVAGDTITATYASAATATTPMGVYSSGANAITATLLDPNGRLANYVVTQNQGTLTINQPSQTITFPAPGTTTYGAAIPLTATATSGLSVSFRVVSGPGSVSGSMFTATAAGVVVLEADQPGNTIFPAAAPVQQAVTVNKAQLIVTPNAATRSYGAPNPTFTGSVTGLVAGDAITVSYSSLANTTTPVGVYSSSAYGITAAVSDPGGRLANYLLSQSVGTLTITQPVQTINFAPLTPVTYGGVPITLNATSSSGLQVTYRIVSGPASVSGSNVTCTGAGVVVIEAGQAGNGSFPAAVPVQQSLVVNRAPLTIMPNSVSRQYGQANPNFSGSITGAISSDAFTSSYSTTATAASPAGVYPITAILNDSMNRGANYLVTVKAATVTVTKATLTVAADNVSRPYGLTDFLLTGKVSGAYAGDAITASYSTGATSISSPGTYAISAQEIGADPANYSIATLQGTLTIMPANATVSLALSTYAAAPGASVTLTATVLSPTSGSPSGSVTFFDGQTSLGVGHPDAKGQVSFSGTDFAAGSHAFTALYGGDADFYAATSSVATLSVGTPDFGVTSDAKSLTIAPGHSGTVDLTVVPVFGFNQPLLLTCGSLPTYLSCQFSPSSITPSGVQASTTQLTVSVAATTSSLRSGHSMMLAGIVPLGLFAILPIYSGRRRWHRLAGMIALCFAIGSMPGCGGGGSSSPSTVTQSPKTPPSGTQAVSITITSGGISHQLPLSIVIKGS